MLAEMLLLHNIFLLCHNGKERSQQNAFLYSVKEKKVENIRKGILFEVVMPFLSLRGAKGVKAPIGRLTNFKEK